MSIPSVALDETSPAGSQSISLGDNRIREYKTQVREVMEVDHVFPSSGTSATGGKHKQLSLIEAADIGTGATGLPILGAQTVSDKPEAMFTDEDDNDIQLTSAGNMGSATTNVLCNNLTPSGVINTPTISGTATFTGDIALTGGLNLGSDATGDIFQRASDGSLARLAIGTARQVPRVNTGATALEYADNDINILDYGTSASASTAKLHENLHICYGSVSVSAGSSTAITNLPFTSATSYSVTVSRNEATNDDAYEGKATMNSGAQFTIYNTSEGTTSFNWIAIGT